MNPDQGTETRTYKTSDEFPLIHESSFLVFFHETVELDQFAISWLINTGIFTSVPAVADPQNEHWKGRNNMYFLLLCVACEYGFIRTCVCAHAYVCVCEGEGGGGRERGRGAARARARARVCVCE